MRTRECSPVPSVRTRVKSLGLNLGAGGSGSTADGDEDCPGALLLPPSSRPWRPSCACEEFATVAAMMRERVRKRLRRLPVVPRRGRASVDVRRRALACAGALCGCSWCGFRCGPCLAAGLRGGTGGLHREGTLDGGRRVGSCGLLPSAADVGCRCRCRCRCRYVGGGGDGGRRRRMRRRRIKRRRAAQRDEVQLTVTYTIHHEMYHGMRQHHSTTSKCSGRWSGR